MNARAWAIAAALGVALASAGPARAATTEPVAPEAPAPAPSVRALSAPGRFEAVTLVSPPTGSPSHLVLQLSGASGVDDALSARARALADRGALVAELSYRTYVGHVRPRTANGCVWPSIDFQSLAKRIEQGEGWPGYVPPIVIGEDEGAALALAAVTQSPPGSFAGLVTIGLCPSLPTGDPPCAARGRLAVTRDAADQPWRLAPPRELTTPWLAIARSSPHRCDAAAGAALVGATPAASLVAPPAPASVAAGAAADAANLEQSLVDAVARLATGAAVTAVPGDALPLIELPPAGEARDTVAIFASGDGGWALLDQQASELLADHGVAVVGWNMGRYLWSERTVGEAARDLERIARAALARWHAEKLVLAGYSSGADLMAVIAHRLPDDLAARLSGVALVGPSSRSDLTPDGAADAARARGVKVLPALEALAGKPILCVRGSEEAASLCPRLPSGLANVVTYRAGHGFKGDQSAIGAAILELAR